MRSNAETRYRCRRLLLVLLPALAVSSATATGEAVPQARVPALVLAPLFADHAVLQRDKADPVWGRAAPGETVSVTFHGRTETTKADGDGAWRVRIGPFRANSDPWDLTVSGGGTITLHDVVVGDIWLCSGQSNMEFIVDDGGDSYQVDHAESEVASAHRRLIRQLKVEQTVALRPQEGVKTGGWVPASPETVGSFTAVGYFSQGTSKTPRACPSASSTAPGAERRCSRG